MAFLPVLFAGFAACRRSRRSKIQIRTVTDAIESHAGRSNDAAARDARGDEIMREVGELGSVSRAASSSSNNRSSRRNSSSLGERRC